MSESDVREQLADYFAWIEAESEFPLSPQLADRDDEQDGNRPGWLGPLLVAAAILVVVGTVWSLFGGTNQPERLRIVDQQEDDVEVPSPSEQRQRKRLAPFGVPDSSEFTLASYELLGVDPVTRSVSVNQVRFQVPGTADIYGDVLISVIQSDAELSIEEGLAGPSIRGAESWVSREGDRAAISWLPSDNELVEIVSRDIPLDELIDFAQQPGIASGDIEPPGGTSDILTGIGRTYPDARDGAHVFSSSRNLDGFQSTLESSTSPPVVAAMFRGDPIAELVTYSTLFPATTVYLSRTSEASEDAIIATDTSSNTKYLVWEETPNEVYDGRSLPNGIVGILEADSSVSDDLLIELVEQMVPEPLPSGIDTSELSDEVRDVVDDLELSGNLVVGARSEPRGADIVYFTVGLENTCVRVVGIEAQPDVCMSVALSRPGSATFIRSIRDDSDGGERSILVVGQSHGGTFDGASFSDPPWSMTRRGLRIDVLSTYQEGSVELVLVEDAGTTYPALIVDE